MDHFRDNLFVFLALIRLQSSHENTISENLERGLGAFGCCLQSGRVRFLKRGFDFLGPVDLRGEKGDLRRVLVNPREETGLINTKLGLLVLSCSG